MASRTRAIQRIPGVTITLTGTDDLAQPIHTVVSTDAGGRYALNELRPGTYTITETRPSGYYSGKNPIGTQGGTVGPNDTLTSIILQPGVNGAGNNFAEMSAGSLSGLVYWDVNHNGVMDSPDFGIVNVLITLDGVDLQGLTVHATTRTDANGAYEFMNPPITPDRLVPTAGEAEGQSGGCPWGEDPDPVPVEVAAASR